MSRNSRFFVYSALFTWMVSLVIAACPNVSYAATLDIADFSRRAFDAAVDTVDEHVTSEGNISAGEVSEHGNEGILPIEQNEYENKKGKNEKALEAFKTCVGKPASEAIKLAESAGLEPKYKDSFEVDVTELLLNADEGSDIRKSLVKSVKVDNGWLFFGPSASVTLDYVEPKAAKERARKEEREAIENCVGESAGKTQILVDKSDYDLVMLDKYDVDITEGIRKAKKGSAVRKAKVSSVEIDNVKGSKRELVTVKIEYTSVVSQKRISKKYGLPYSMTISEDKVEVIDENPAKAVSTYVIDLSGTLTNNDSWSVKVENLPQFIIREGDDSPLTYNLRVDTQSEEIKAVASVRFALAVRVSDPKIAVKFKCPHGNPSLKNAAALASKIVAEYQRVCESHDANVAYYQEEEKRAKERDRRAQTCYVTETGDCYHSTTGCPALSRSKNLYEKTVGWAEDNGLSACDRCH